MAEVGLNKAAIEIFLAIAKDTNRSDWPFACAFITLVIVYGAVIIYKFKAETLQATTQAKEETLRVTT